MTDERFREADARSMNDHIAHRAYVLKRIRWAIHREKERR
jgi:hypothetical protein